MSVSSGSVIPPSATRAASRRRPRDHVRGRAKLIAGSAQTHTSGRWGDYHDVRRPHGRLHVLVGVLPTTAAGWHTRIGSFRWPPAARRRCLPSPSPTVTGEQRAGECGVYRDALPVQRPDGDGGLRDRRRTTIAPVTSASGTLAFSPARRDRGSQVTGDTEVELQRDVHRELALRPMPPSRTGGVGTIVNDDTAPPPTGTITVTAPDGGEAWP